MACAARGKARPPLARHAGSHHISARGAEVGARGTRAPRFTRIPRREFLKRTPMQQFNPNPSAWGGTIARSRVEVDQGLRAFMLGVYNNMVLGLAISALV